MTTDVRIGIVIPTRGPVMQSALRPPRETLPGDGVPR